MRPPTKENKMENETFAKELTKVIVLNGVASAAATAGMFAGLILVAKIVEKKSK